MVHVLSASASATWEACVGGRDADHFATAVARSSGTETTVVDADVASFVDELAARGLVGRTEPVERPTSPEWTEVTGRHASRPVATLDDRIVVRSDDPDVVVAVEVAFGTTTGGSATRVRPDHGAGGSHPHRGLRPGVGRPRSGRRGGALAGEINRVAVTTSTVLALHASGVRSPGGQVVVLPAESGLREVDPGRPPGACRVGLPGR